MTAFVEDHRRISFGLRNTADEPVVFDFEVLVNGIQSNTPYLNCGSPYETDLACKKVVERQQPFIYKGQQLSVRINYPRRCEAEADPVAVMPVEALQRVTVRSLRPIAPLGVASNASEIERTSWRSTSWNAERGMDP